MYVKSAPRVVAAPMPEPRRTQSERREATRAKLLDAGRNLFEERGYEAVGTPEIVAAAGVTRGALYHHFDGKRELFAAVYEAIEAEIVASFPFDRMVGDDPFGALRAGISIFLELSLDARVQQVALIDAPSVLGWERWHEVQQRYGLAIIEAGLGAAMEAGQVRKMPVKPLSNVLLGALIEAALSVAASSDQRKTMAEYGTVLEAMLDGLRS